MATVVLNIHYLPTVDTEEGEDRPSGHLLCFSMYLPTVDTEEGEDGPSGHLLYILACICPLRTPRR